MQLDVQQIWVLQCNLIGWLEALLVRPGLCNGLIPVLHFSCRSASGQQKSGDSTD